MAVSELCILIAYGGRDTGLAKIGWEMKMCVFVL